MGGPPAAIIIVRHGTRLDSADPKWHLTSPTPYDTPLTYGGWTQSRALGARIASVLQSLDERSKSDDSEAGPESPRKKRKHKVVIHSSPFLRCIQTSVGIASGLATNAAHGQAPQHSTPTRQIHSDPFRNSPTMGARSKMDSPRLEPIPEPATSPAPNFTPNQHATKAVLRIDAFLGEWLSPDYFMQITPPPSSVMMVASAKADLLRREDYAHLSYNIPMPASGFPGGWGESIPPEREQDLPALPFARDRTSSMSSAGSNGSGGRPRPFSRGHGGPHNSDNGTYAPPVPHYAISMSDPIPPGYVCHAKDAALTVDYQWDSMREPQNWGNGGEYGEEWSSMHKRVRRGLAKMIDWYREHDGSVATASRPTTSSGQGSSNTDDEDDTDLVVVLVSHGACCNALIGAMTNQPVLLDVGMTNLTMAVRKPPSRTPFASPRATPSHSRNPSRQMTLSDEYDMILLNSGEHLRRSSLTSSRSATPQLLSLPLRPFLNRENLESNNNLNTPFVEPISLGEPIRSSFSTTANPNFGSIRRTVSVASGSGSSASGLTYTPNFKGSIGLWKPTKRVDEEEKVEEGTEGDDMVLNFAEEREAKASQTPSPESPRSPKVEKSPAFAFDKKFGIEGKGKEKEKEMPERSDTAKTADGLLETVPKKGTGLWPGPRPPAELGTKPERLPGAKRRWTVTERQLS